MCCFVCVCVEMVLEQKCTLLKHFTISNYTESHEPIRICDNEFLAKMSSYFPFNPLLYPPFYLAWQSMK